MEETAAVAAPSGVTRPGHSDVTCGDSVETASRDGSVPDGAEDVHGDKPTELLEFSSPIRRKSGRLAVSGGAPSDLMQMRGTVMGGPLTAAGVGRAAPNRAKSGDGMVGMGSGTDFRSRPSSFRRIARTPSSSNTRRGARRGPARSVSTDGIGLGAMRHTRLYAQQALLTTSAPGLEKDRDFMRRLNRTKSDDSCGTANTSSSMGDNSFDVADPIVGGAADDGRYYEEYSCADHDSVWDSMSQYSRESAFFAAGQVVEVLPNGQMIKPPASRDRLRGNPNVDGLLHLNRMSIQTVTRRKEGEEDDDGSCSSLEDEDDLGDGINMDSQDGLDVNRGGAEHTGTTERMTESEMTEGTSEGVAARAAGAARSPRRGGSAGAGEESVSNSDASFRETDGPPVRQGVSGEDGTTDVTETEFDLTDHLDVTEEGDEELLEESDTD